jgi:4-amino-4-deoxy-L-arabinose transferase-like glycosyltransferase
MAAAMGIASIPGVRGERSVPPAWIAVGALTLLALGWGLGGYPLLEPDEGRNAQVAREMARGGDWVLPHLNGLPYLDKPALYFAAVALGLKVFGDSEGGARAASLAFVFGTVLVVWRLGRRMGPPGTGEIAAVALATMPLALAYSRTVIPDPALLFLETATLGAAWRGFADESRAVRWFALSWALAGFGLITKGPVAIIVPVLIFAAWGRATGVRLRPYFALRAWPWMLLTGLPWLIVVSLRRPDFLYYAVVFESLQRFATTTHGRQQPIWFFVPVVLAGSFPWIVPAIAGLAQAVRRRAARRSDEGRAVVFAIAWALVPIVFFSFSQSKLAGYCLPALPGVALGAGLFFASALRDQAIGISAARSCAVVASMLLALALAMAVGIRFVTAVPRLATPVREAIPGFALAFAAALAVAAALAAWGAHRSSVWIGAAALALPLAIVPFIGSPLMRAVGRDRSSIDLAAAIERAAPVARVVAIAVYPTSLRYYLDRPVLMTTDTGDEMFSHYVGSRFAEFRDLPGSPLRPVDWWRTALDACDEPTVFVARDGAPESATLAAQLPRIGRGGASGRVIAYGPCGARPAPAAR